MPTFAVPAEGAQAREPVQRQPFMKRPGASIRKTLLLAFLLVGVTPAVLLALLGFNRASQAVQAEI